MHHVGSLKDSLPQDLHTMNLQAMAAHPETVVTAGETLRDPTEAKRAVVEVIIDCVQNPERVALK